MRPSRRYGPTSSPDSGVAIDTHLGRLRVCNHDLGVPAYREWTRCRSDMHGVGAGMQGHGEPAIPVESRHPHLPITLQELDRTGNRSRVALVRRGIHHWAHGPGKGDATNRVGRTSRAFVTREASAQVEGDRPRNQYGCTPSHVGDDNPATVELPRERVTETAALEPAGRVEPGSSASAGAHRISLRRKFQNDRSTSGGQFFVAWRIPSIDGQAESAWLLRLEYSAQERCRCGCVFDDTRH